MAAVSASMQNVFLLHGLMATTESTYWQQVASWEGRYRVVPIDLPGHGASTVDARQPYFDNAIRMVRERVETEGGGHLVGVSYLGGTIALRCALTEPRDLRSLVLSGFQIGIPEDVFVAWVSGFPALADENPHMAATYAQLHGARWRATLEAVIGDSIASYQDTVAISPEMLAELRVPTLLINGTLKSDERAAVSEFPRYSPMIRAAAVAGAGHMPCREQAKAFNAVVEQFWREVA
jgi:pimeloyl-ACP methyl ester carboxylesterase